MRLIDAKDLLELVRKNAPFIYHILLPIVAITPTIEAEPVLHGRWEWITEDIYRCTNCGTTNHVKEVMGKPDYNYCPECGADMRGRNNNGICEKS